MASTASSFPCFIIFAALNTDGPSAEYHHQHWCIPFKIQGFVQWKNDCFCSLQIWKDLDKKFKLCDSHMSSSGHLSFKNINSSCYLCLDHNMWWTSCSWAKSSFFSFSSMRESSPIRASRASCEGCILSLVALCDFSSLPQRDSLLIGWVFCTNSIRSITHEVWLLTLAFTA